MSAEAYVGKNVSVPTTCVHEDPSETGWDDNAKI